MRLKLLYLLILCTALFACNKDEDITFDQNARLNFSSDSVLFDTVFTSVGSTSRRLKIFNYNKQAINIEDIKLAGGDNSPFNININGLATNQTKNLKINGNDSINVFVKVTIDPNAQNQTFIVQDSILLFFNGKTEKIALVAYGQNAIFLNNQRIDANTVWDSKLPYIVYNSITIAENANLAIAPGTKVLFHGNATMNIKGTLTANGTKADSIVFSSDRLERIYQDEPGQWNGIHFYGSSKNSIMNYSVIKNATAGITVDSVSSNSNPKLILANSIVKNMEVVGFLGYHADLTGFNNLFFNCGQYLIYGIGGGKYNLKQNTFAAYNFNFARKTPAIYLSDFISATEFNSLNVNLTNNIIYGSLDEEFAVENKSTAVSAIEIKNNLIKTKKTVYTGNGNIFNIDPLFIAPRYGLFNLQFGSPVLDMGISLSNDAYYDAYLKNDILAEKRLFPSDLGCYENN
jgi:hypothetical protein